MFAAFHLVNDHHMRLKSSGDCSVAFGHLKTVMKDPVILAELRLTPQVVDGTCSLSFCVLFVLFF